MTHFGRTRRRALLSSQPSILGSFATILLAFTPFSAAEPPTSVRHAAFATAENKALYIAGGFLDGIPTSQVYTLDLTIPTWSSSDPPWDPLPPLPPALALEGLHGSLINSQTEFFIAGNISSAATFSLRDRKWQLLPVRPAEYTNTLDVAVVEIESTPGKVVVPTGYRNPSSALEARATALFDTKANIVTKAPGLESVVGIPSNLRSYALAWSSLRSSALLLGGRQSLTGGLFTPNNDLLEFSALSLTWKVVNTTGLGPPSLTSPCMIPVYNGAKMAVFGGVVTGGISSSIYFLDVQTMAWTKGKDIENSLKRFDHVCTAAGDSFVAWGGYGGGGAATSTTPVIYDMVKGEWTTQFSLSSSSSPSDPPNTTDGKGQDSNFNVGAIAGGVAATLVVLFLIAGFTLRRRRMQQRQLNSRIEDQEYVEPWKGQGVAGADKIELPDSDLSSPQGTLSQKMRSPQLYSGCSSSLNQRFVQNPHGPLSPHEQLSRPDEGMPSSPQALVEVSDAETEQLLRLKQEELLRLELAHEIQLKKIEIDGLMSQRR